MNDDLKIEHELMKKDIETIKEVQKRLANDVKAVETKLDNWGGGIAALSKAVFIIGAMVGVIVTVLKFALSF